MPLAAKIQLNIRADTLGAKIMANILSDVGDSYFSRAIYAQLMDYIDFPLFEVWVEGRTEAEATTHLGAAQDMVNNHIANPVVVADSIWESLAALLLVRNNDKGILWVGSSLPSEPTLTKLMTLDCGTPTEDYVYNGTYYRRDWSNDGGATISCIILLNLKSSSTGSISLGATYQNLQTGSNVSSINLGATSGAVLVAI
jgi:hypothetical protein